MSGVDDTALHKVWELANFDDDGLDGLTASEYVVAMHLIFRLRGGHALPAQLTVGMVEAARRYDAVVVADGYQQAVVISWGDPVLPGAPAFDVTNQTGDAQRGQFGIVSHRDKIGMLNFTS